jgi:hypothetical protein
MPSKRRRRPELHKYSSIAQRPPLEDRAPQRRARMIMVLIVALLIAGLAAAMLLFRGRL